MKKKSENGVKWPFSADFLHLCTPPFHSDGPTDTANQLLNLVLAQDLVGSLVLEKKSIIDYYYPQ